MNTDDNNKPFSSDDIDNLLLSSSSISTINHKWQPNLDNIGNIATKLSLVSLHQTSINFSISLLNISKIPLFVVFPIYFEEYFIFKNNVGISVIKWSLEELVTMDSESIPGQIINSNQSKIIDLKMNLNSHSINPFEGSLQLPSGTYDCYFHFSVDSNYFCPYTHLQYSDLLNFSKSKNIHLWEGRTTSNIISFMVS